MIQVLLINGEQMTIVWHVDDLKVSQKDLWEVSKIAKWLSSLYGDIKVQHGKKLDYLGMTLDYSIQHEVKISMIPHIQELIQNLLEEIIGYAATPAANHHFDTATK